MANPDTEFLKRLLTIFAIEAQEHIDALYSGVRELENNADREKQPALIETVFREAHSLKGAAHAVKMKRIETVCQTLESTFAAIKHKDTDLNPEVFGELYRTIDNISTMLDAENSLQTPVETPANSVSENRRSAPASGLNKGLTQRKTEPAITHQDTSFANKRKLSDTVRVSTAKLDAVLLQAEELLTVKLTAQQRTAELQQILDLLNGWEKDWTDFRSFIGLAENQQPQQKAFLDSTSAFIAGLSDRLKKLEKSTGQDNRLLNRGIDTLLSDIKQASMQPFSTLTETFPALVREFAADRGKDIRLMIEGGDIEADRRILEGIKDPLMHLIRNCIDHGIETSKQRLESNKSSSGTIRISFTAQEGNRVDIKIADDGIGIDPAKIKATAKRLGLLSSEQLATLDHQQTLDLVYRSGFSTSPILTEISGRGLGLAIVQEKVEKLGGKVTLENNPGQGLAFRLLLPLMFSSYRGIVVSIDKQLFVIPTTGVEQILRIDSDSITTVENRETVSLHGAILGLVRLNEVLTLPHRYPDGRKQLPAVVLTAYDKRMAFLVDEIIGEQEILVKSLGKQLSRVKNIAGATLLGPGKVVPVLNVSDLIKSVLSTDFQPTALKNQNEAAVAKKSILVVEDSLTTRSLLKGILESAGYQVVTAVDGVDGLTRLRSEEFDIVLTDVEMPRMNGFELTARIRSEKKFAALPVVLLTALASREDREHGIDVGANAYLVKNSFEQNNLLEIVQRLI